MKEKVETTRTCPHGSFAYTIRSGDTLYFLAIRYNTTVSAIMALNPGINPNNLQIGQVICIPGSAPGPGPTPPCSGFIYTIRPGDTFYSLSRQFNVSVEAIMRANPGVDPNNLQIGQRICIPGSVPPMPPCQNGFYYTIRSGDTLYQLSLQFNVSVEAIIRANPGINPNNLQIGQTICIPRPVTPTPPCQNGFYYSVRAGDTFYTIAQRYNTSVEAMIRANPGVNPNNLQIGQIICVPYR